METPQDLIKPVPPAPGGQSTPRGPADTGRSSDGGADFAEAMRTARQSSRSDARETQAPDRRSREAPEDASDEPIYASKDKDVSADAPGSASTTDRPESAPQATASQAPPGAAASAQQATQVAAAPAQAQVAPLDLPVVAPPIGDGAATGEALQAIAQATAAAKSPAPAPIENDLLAQATTPVDQLADLAPGQAAADRLAVTAPRLDAASAPTIAATQPGPEASPVAAQPVSDNDVEVALPNNLLPNTTQPTGTAQAAPVGVAPASVAMTVDRAIGNAIVERPATGTFKPADLAAQPPVDPARIASAGFVAAALQPAAPKEPLPVLSPLGEPTAAADGGEPSVWLTVRPDSLAMALADRALSQDATTQLPLKLDQMLQSLDTRVLGMTTASTMSMATAQGDAAEPLGAIAALADAQTNQAIPAQAAGMAADGPEPVSLSLNAPMQQATRWAAEFGDRLAWVANNRFNAATLQVNPPQLGPIEVRILMSGDQATVSFAAVQPQTREAIQQALPVLASSFASQGLNLGQTSVGRDHLPQQGGQGGSGGNGGGQPGLVATAVGGTDNVTAGANTRGGNGLVDTFA